MKMWWLISLFFAVARKEVHGKNALPNQILQKHFIELMSSQWAPLTKCILTLKVHAKFIIKSVSKVFFP